MDNFTCSVCGKSHEGAPLSWGPAAPDMWANIPNENRMKRGELGSDQCVIDDMRFFIRGRLEIPITDMEEKFAWLVWTEVSATDFLDMNSKWTSEGRESTAPYSGRIANELHVYPEPTIGISVRLHTRPVGMRPFIEITDDHLLHQEQKKGISLHQIGEIAERILSSG